MPDLVALFASLTQASDWQSAMLASALGDASVLGHPLGFKVVRLDDGPTSLRVHLWRAADREQPGFEVHDHSFDLESFVLAGAVRQRTFAADPDPSGEHAVYTVAYEAGESLLRRTDQVVRLRELTDEVFTAGATYRVAAGQLHASVLDECETAVTLVLTQNRGRLPITIGPRDGPLDLRASRRPLSGLSFRELGLPAAHAL